MAYLDRLVSNARNAGFQQRLRQRFARGKVEIGEENLPLAQQPIFGRKRFLHLHDHFRFTKELRRVIDDPPPGLGVRFVIVTGADASAQPPSGRPGHWRRNGPCLPQSSLSRRFPGSR